MVLAFSTPPWKMGTAVLQRQESFEVSWASVQWEANPGGKD